MSNKYFVYSETRNKKEVSKRMIQDGLTRDEANELRDIYLIQNTDPHTIYEIKKQDNKVVAEINV